jgi:hypothetical protein
MKYHSENPILSMHSSNIPLFRVAVMKKKSNIYGNLIKGVEKIIKGL